SPLGRGLLTGSIREDGDLRDDDWRRRVPRFQGDNLERNVALLAPLEAIARGRGVTPATIALAWLLARGEEVVPLVGTGRAEHVEGNLEALEVRLEEDEIATLDAAFPADAAAGERYPPEYLASLNR